MKRIVLVSFVAFVALFSLSAGVMAGETPKKVRLRMPVCIPTKFPLINFIPYFAEQVELASNGTIQFKIYEPGQLIPAFEIQEAVSKGQIECGWSAAVYISGQIPAASLFTTVPFGPDLVEYIAWFYYGNGRKLYQEMYDKYGFNVKVWPMLMVPMESGGWFRKPIKSVEDFKGMRLRWPGLGGKVLSKLGASISTIPGGEIFPSLEKGVIDGTEFGPPVLDAAVGFWKVAKYNYFPGWHQTCTAMEFTMNKDTWNKLSKGQQAIIELAVTDINIRGVANAESRVGKILMENAQKRGVKNMVYPPEVLKALQKAWLEVVAEESAKDPFFKKVWQDLNGFMKEYEVMQSVGYKALPPQKFE